MDPYNYKLRSFEFRVFGLRSQDSVFLARLQPDERSDGVTTEDLKSVSQCWHVASSHNIRANTCFETDERLW